MVDKIKIPVLIAPHADALDYGGAATSGKSAKEAIHNHIRNIALNKDTFDTVIDTAAKLVQVAADAATKSPRLKVDNFSFQIGVSASGSVGFLGTGANFEAEAVFEICFSIVPE